MTKTKKQPPPNKSVSKQRKTRIRRRKGAISRGGEVKSAETARDAYDAHKAAAAARQQALSQAARNIPEIPEVEDPERKARAARNFRLFCETYFPHTFSIAWSQDHLNIIEIIEQVVLQGGLVAVAMPRGSGKTSLAECACMWAALYGHREFVALIGATEPHACEMLDSLKMEFEENALLAADFPEAIFPIICLNGIPNRCGGQLYRGARTHIAWTATEIVLPMIPESKAAGAIIKVAGITGRIRGMKYKRGDGSASRPSLVIIDDPQTDESANSLAQCATRERILAGSILGLAGPRKKISGIMPCTVTRLGDVADNILSLDKHPEWNGRRCKMVYSFPKNEALWKQYAEVRAESLRRTGTIKAATEFYKKNQAAMDEGALVGWKERFNHDEASALQHAVNLRLQDERAFFSEYQNEPLAEPGLNDIGLLSADQIAQKLNGIERGMIPLQASKLVCAIDVQGNILFWTVAALEEDFTGYIIAYGTYPQQRKDYFSLREVEFPLQAETKNANLEGSIYAGLETLCNALLSGEWQRDDGARMRIERCLIDANWGESTDIVYQFCRQNAHAAVLLPMHGRFVGAAGKPFAEYAKRRGDRIGLNWKVPYVKGKRVIRHVIYDSNFWKSFLHNRLAVPMGDKGCFSLFGKSPEQHRMFAEHLTAEYRERVAARGRIIDEWKLRPGIKENHYFDCLTGCCVAASMMGAVLPGTEEGQKQKSATRPVRLSDLQKSMRRR